MLKGEEPEEVFIAPMTSIQVYIDEDDAVMWPVGKIENGQQIYSVPQVLSLGPVTEVVCERLPGLYRFAVAYLTPAGWAFARSGKYTGDEIWWSDEVAEEPSYAGSGWRYMN